MVYCSVSGQEDLLIRGASVIRSKFTPYPVLCLCMPLHAQCRKLWS